MNIKPLFDKVVVESVNVEEKTKSGFFLPSSAQEKPQTCVVVAVGPGGIIDGKERSVTRYCAPNMRARNSRLTARNLQSLNKATFSPSSKTDFNKRKYRIISYKETNYHG